MDSLFAGEAERGALLALLVEDIRVLEVGADLLTLALPEETHRVNSL
jgi:hypothetical protein